MEKSSTNQYPIRIITYIAVLVVGYLIVSLTIWGTARQTDERLGLIAEQYVPATQYSTDAEVYFSGMMRDYEAAVLTGESSLLKSAAGEAAKLERELIGLMTLDRLSPQLNTNVQYILSVLIPFSESAADVYGRLILELEETDYALVEEARQLALTQDQLRTCIQNLSHRIAEELQIEMATAVTHADRRRNAGILLFFGLLLILSVSSIYRHYRIARREIEERKRAEASLMAREHQLRILFDGSPDAIYVQNQDGDVVAANQAACRLHGLAADELVGRNVYDLVAEKESIYVKANMERWFAGESFYHIGCSKGAGGREIPVEIHSSRIQYEDRPALLLHVRDITKRIETEDALAEEKERLAVTLRSIGDAVIATGQDARIMVMNRAAEMLTGRSEAEAIGQLLSSVFSPVDMHSRELLPNPVERVLHDGEVRDESNILFVSRTGARYIVAYSAAPIRDSYGHLVGAVLAIKDETQKQQLEEEQLKLEKLESLGVLAGGIAHDFNNLLTAILGNISMARLSQRSPSEQDELLTEAEKASLRARNLTQQLLTFAKGGEPVKRVIALSDLITEAAGFVLRGSASKLSIHVDDPIWPVWVDPGQISQVIHNIVLNADQAMPNGGTITIYAHNRELAEGQSLHLESGSYVEMKIEDTGVGIPEESLGKIFDPYFTTKQQGSGLGLATCYSIIQKHGGHIGVVTQQGKGTTFYIYLPASQEAFPDAPVERSFMAEHRGEGRILVMDDEEAICGILAKLLERVGYDVVTTLEGTKAISEYKQAMEDGNPFDAVILDLTIPGGMGGRDIIQILRRMDPAVAAIVSSGYSNDPAMSNAEAYGFRGVVSKPYKTAELLSVMESVLNKRRGKGKTG